MTQSDGQAAAIPTVTLNDENTIPVIGLGVGELSDSETEQAVSTALETVQVSRRRMASNCSGLNSFILLTRVLRAAWVRFVGPV